MGAVCQHDLSRLFISLLYRYGGYQFQAHLFFNTPNLELGRVLILKMVIKMR